MNQLESLYSSNQVRTLVIEMADKSKIDNVRRGNFGPKNGFWKGGKSIANNK